FTLPMAESATLELYDGLGNRILSLPQGVVSAGGHSIAIGPGILRTLADGIYFYRLVASSGIAFGRMIVKLQR
ncbi:MAG TPA: T9SS type A sorting domain-containing protein, partial [Candidatus Kapabacteria bacterium]